MSQVLRSLPDASAMLFDDRLVIETASGPALVDEVGLPADCIGRRARDVFAAGRWRLYEPLLRAALEGRSTSTKVESAQSGRRYVVDTEPLRDADGVVVGA